MASEKREKSKKIQFRVTPDEYELIEKKINETNLTKTDYFRKLIYEGKINIIQPLSVIKMQGLGREINKIGVNINQIAKIVNERGDYNKDDIEYLKEEHEKLKQLIFSRLYIHTDEEIQQQIFSRKVSCIDVGENKKYKVVGLRKNEDEKGMFLVIKRYE